jgi:hypothetical protein
MGDLYFGILFVEGEAQDNWDKKTSWIELWERKWLGGFEAPPPRVVIWKDLFYDL